MMIQRLLAVIMILGSSVLVAWPSGDIAFPAILGMLGLLGVLRRFTWDIRPERHFITPLLLLLLAILFALHCRYAHIRPDQAAAFAWQTIARYFLASMVLLLFLRPHRIQDRGWKTESRGQIGDLLRSPSSVVCPPVSALPHSLGLFHLASVLAAGQVLLLDDRYVTFRLTELLSVTLVILYAALDGREFRISDFGFRIPGVRLLQSAIRNPQSAIGRSVGGPFLGSQFGSWLPLALLLLVAINVGWVGGSMLYRHVETINFLPAWLSRGAAALETTTAEVAHVAFSTSGKLSSVLSIKEDADATPVLTLLGDSNPVYLRAMAFETYHQSTWHDLSYREAIPPEQNTAFGTLLVGRTNLFRLRHVGANEDSLLREITIRHESSIADAMFTPLGTRSVEAPLNLLMRDDDDVISSPATRNRLSYRVAYAAASERAPSGAQSRRMTAIPSQLDPGIRARAQRIFRGCTTTAQKIEAVTRYFRTNYTYALGLDVPAGRDALNYFLLEASSGYCEYFASGAAILLRFEDVPTRYVTGFLVTEPGDDRRTWVARNMDAHAWAEAWDAEQGQWVIVEATSQEGLGDVSLADELARSAGGGRPLLTRLVEALYEYGLFGVIGVAWRLTGLVLLLLAVVVVARVLRPGWMTGRGRSGPRTQGQDGLATLHRLLAAMDRKTRALGYRRRSEETLHAFAGRIQGSAGSHSPPGTRPPTLAPRVADWYLQYAGLRYARVLDPARVEQLQLLAQEPHDRR
jgi:transglutaminase-like putative cysteine protease